MDDLYAHSSQILLKTIGGVDYLFLVYAYNKVSGVEGNVNEKRAFKIFDLGTMTLLRTIEPNAGGWFYFLGDNLRFYGYSTSTLYVEDFDMSNSDYNEWTLSGATVAKMTMKDSSGNDVLADVTSENLNIHFDYIFGDNYDGYHDLMPMFRNMDIAKNGNNWYTTLECSGELSHNLAGPTVIVISSDGGNTWALGSPVGYTTSSRVRVIEPSVIFSGANLHIIARSTSNSYWNFMSEDNGATWEQQINITLDGVLRSKPCAINYNDGTEKNMIAIQEISKVEGYPGRTTLWIGDLSLTLKEEIMTPTYIHYPSMFYFKNKIYMSYTKGLKGTDAQGDRDSIAIREISLV